MMDGIPTPQQFQALAMSERAHRELLMERTVPLEMAFDMAVAGDAEIAELASQVISLYDETWLHGDNDAAVAFDWLLSQPSVKLVLEELGFFPAKVGVEPDSRLVRAERAVRHWMKRNMKSRCLLASEAEWELSTFRRYMCGLAEACYGYLSKSGARKAIEGPVVIERMKSLLLELGQLANSEWITGRHRQELSRLVRSSDAIDYLDEKEDFILDSPSRRNDPDLPARVMAYDLISLHRSLFGAPHKRALFQLMGLPFIDRPLEMRTIERLAKKQKEDRRQKIEKNRLSSVAKNASK